MDREEILSCPIGELYDMIACMQICNGARPKVYGDIDDLAAIR